MKIQVLKRKINPDKEFIPGVHVVLDPEEFPDIVEKLNSIVDWDASDFPLIPDSGKLVKKDVTEDINKIIQTVHMMDPNIAMDELMDCILSGEEIVIDGQRFGVNMKNVTHDNGVWEAEIMEYDQDRTVLGDVPELKPGDMFAWGGSQFAICNIYNTPSIALSNTTTGQGVLKRFVKEHIIPEYNFTKRLGMIEFNIDTVEIQNPSECMLLLGTDENNLDYYINEPDIFKGIKLQYGSFRFLLSQLENLKYELIHKKSILHIVCSPLFGTADLWIDGNGTVVYNIGEFVDLVGIKEEELFDYFLPELLEYLKTNPYISQTPDIQTQKEDITE